MLVTPLQFCTPPHSKKAKKLLLKISTGFVDPVTFILGLIRRNQEIRFYIFLFDIKTATDTADTTHSSC